MTGSTLKAGARGTRRLVRLYGDRLLRVRYLYDADRRRRLTTVELIVDEGPWSPPAPSDTLVPITLRNDELDLRQRLRAAGATWDFDRKAWLLPRAKAVALGLASRISRPKAD